MLASALSGGSPPSGGGRGGGGTPPSGSGSGGGPSPNPTDRFIRDLVDTRRPATAAEIEQILQRLETAIFDRRMRPVPAALRGRVYRGHVAGAREPALYIHLLQRVLGDQQWAHGTTEAEYLADLRQGVRATGSRLVIYHARAGAIALTFGPNSVPAARQGAKAQPWLVVVYSADRGTLISGYQASGLPAVRISGDAQWLT